MALVFVSALALVDAVAGFVLVVSDFAVTSLASRSMVTFFFALRARVRALCLVPGFVPVGFEPCVF